MKKDNAKNESKSIRKGRRPGIVMRKVVPFQGTQAEGETATAVIDQPEAPPTAEIPAGIPALTESRITDQPAEIAVIEKLALPLPVMQAAAAIAAMADEGRSVLRNVFIHSVDPGHVHIAATDARRFFVARVPVTTLPTWAESGILLGVAGLEPRLKFLATGGEWLVCSHIGGTSTAELRSADEEITLRHSINDGTFPAYDQLTTAASFSEEEIASEFSTVPVACDTLKTVQKLAGLLKGDSKEPAVRQFRGREKANVVFDFPTAPGVMLIVAPMNVEGPAALPAATASLVKSAVDGTIAALKAHATRARKAGDKAKAADFAARIKVLIERTSAPALPEAREEAAESEAGE